MHFARRPPNDDWKALFFMLILTAILALIVLAPLVRAGYPMPMVEEHYDAVVVAHECLAERDWNLRRAYFIRGGKVIAERAVCDEMLWTVQDGKFLLAWDDYGACKRRVTFDCLIEYPIDEAPSHPQDENPWWGMGRNMRDLAQPEVDK